MTLKLCVWTVWVTSRYGSIPMQTPHSDTLPSTDNGPNMTNSSLFGFSRSASRQLVEREWRAATERRQSAARAAKAANMVPLPRTAASASDSSPTMTSTMCGPSRWRKIMTPHPKCFLSLPFFTASCVRKSKYMGARARTVRVRPYIQIFQPTTTRRTAGIEDDFGRGAQKKADL